MIQATVDFMNKTYEFYGRKLVWEHVVGNCPLTPPDDAKSAQAANEVAKKKPAFVIHYAVRPGEPRRLDPQRHPQPRRPEPRRADLQRPAALPVGRLPERHPGRRLRLRVLLQEAGGQERVQRRGADPPEHRRPQHAPESRPHRPGQRQQRLGPERRSGPRPRSRRAPAAKRTRRSSPTSPTSTGPRSRPGSRLPVSSTPR